MSAICCSASTTVAQPFCKTAPSPRCRRTAMFCRILAEAPRCHVVPPEGGMFVLFDIRPTGLSAEEFAQGLLYAEHVATLPCDGFGASAEGYLRICLGVPDTRLEEAGRRIVRYAQRLAQR